MNLDKMATIVSKIGTNQQVWQDKCQMTSRHKDFLWKTLTGKTQTMISKESSKDEDIRGRSQQDWKGSKSPLISLSNLWIW